MANPTCKQCREFLTGSVSLRTLRGLVLVVHLFPGISIATAGAIFYLLVTGGVQRFHSVLMLFSSMFLISAAIGSMNDYLDVDLDRGARPNKPLIRGDIQPATALLVSGVAATAGILLSVWFGWTTVAIALLPLASGMVYNFWAKGTIWSWVPYAISISALPVWAFVAAGKFKPLVLLTLPLGILVSLAVNSPTLFRICRTISGMG